MHVQGHQGDVERCHGSGPDDAFVVVILFNGGRHDAGDSDAIATHLHGSTASRFVEDFGFHGLAVAVTQLKNMTHFDATGNLNDWLNLQDREQFESQILAPLYERLNINSPSDVETRQFEIHSALKDMTLRQAYESQGYRYNDRLIPRPPIRGSIAMASAGPNLNRAEFFFLLVDAPWLAGKATVIGEVVEGMEIVDRIDQSAVLRGETTAPTPTTATLIFDVRQVNALPSQ